MRQKFSDRIGITEPNTLIQIDSMTKELRNKLWSSFEIYFFEESREVRQVQPLVDSKLYKMAFNLWLYYFKFPTDNIPLYDIEFKSIIRDYFFKADWYQVYNLLDFCLDFADQIFPNKQDFIKFTNFHLKEELSGFRIIDDCFVPITNEEQIKCLNDSLNISKSKDLFGVYAHISASIQLLANKELNGIDKYRNTIKEAISAVEALCNKLNNKKSKGLSGALNQLQPKIKIHSSLEQGFIKLYGYTSDSDGIRHPIMDEPDLDLEDAVYMLVTCSAFVNYIIQKADKAGLI